jgi:hypothetical protein
MSLPSISPYFYPLIQNKNKTKQKQDINFFPNKLICHFHYKKKKREREREKRELYW